MGNRGVKLEATTIPTWKSRFFSCTRHVVVSEPLSALKCDARWVLHDIRRWNVEGWASLVTTYRHGKVSLFSRIFTASETSLMWDFFPYWKMKRGDSFWSPHGGVVSQPTKRVITVLSIGHVISRSLPCSNNVGKWDSDNRLITDGNRSVKIPGAENHRRQLNQRPPYI